ncbi:hypothetical protein [Hyphomicrobium sp.]|uniref:hypothetical protein n=1 Tax=Hyphomicrobium sp. TaxID=82 RepID=UPI0025C1C496|nr:hypothetical protein [Hyphomicrobium sp.]MCC7251450.1 hypothetical protein [Hyphomicrobium sp.]
MRTLKVLPFALAALLVAASWGASAFAQDEQPAEPEAATSDASADSSSDAAPAEAAGEEKPAE